MVEHETPFRKLSHLKAQAGPCPGLLQDKGHARRPIRRERLDDR
jgi:hypothetical protein